MGSVSKHACKSMLIGISLLIPALVLAAVGRTPGQFTVSPTGSALYAIPIWAPPGVQGIQPKLALTYNSQSGNGLLGVGWTLSGFSTISRCNRTYAQDGGGGSPQLDADDRFCLDGKRLRSVSGTYGADGSTYQTEIADFSNVISHGTAGSGPAWFEVKGKDGLYYEYGHTPDSAIVASGSSAVRVWALSSVRDRAGNSMTFVYSNDTTNGSYRPQSIKYTYTAPNPSTYYYQVDFVYQSRPSADVLWSYTIGGKNDEPNYLSSIDVKTYDGSTWTPTRNYVLTYQNGPTTSRTRLHTIQECAGTDCLAPTTISYQDGQSGWGGETAQSGSLTNMHYALPIDVNADGIDDLVYPDTSGNWYYLLGATGGSFAGPYDTSLANTNYAAALPIDFNSDGKMDVLVPNTSGNWRVLYFQSAGGAFTYTDTSTPALSTTQGNAAAEDIDGDGRDDLVYAYEAGTGWGAARTLYYRRNTGGAFSGTQSTLYAIQSGGTTGPFTKWGTGAPLGDAASRFKSAQRRLDFNNDGRDDLLIHLANCSADLPGQCNSSSTTYTWRIVMSQADGSYAGRDVVGYAYGSGSSTPPLTGDFNGDGCTDMARPSGSTWWLFAGNCWRSGGTYTLQAGFNTGSAYYGSPGYALDWDGDGRDDLISPNSSSPQSYGYARSTGATLGAWTSLSIPYTSAQTTMIADVNGDGQHDFLYAVSNALKTRTHSGVLPDLATAFVDGFGIAHSPSYVPLTAGSYTKYSDASTGYQDYQGPLHVVSSVSASNGIGGTYTQSFQYYGAWMNVQGRGFAGFAARRMQDSRNSVYDYEYYRRDFPYTAMVSELRRYQPNGTTYMGRVVNTPNAMTLSSSLYNERYFPYVQASTTYQYEVGGAGFNGQLITQTDTTLTYDSYGNATQIGTTTTDQDSNSPLYGSSWNSVTANTITNDAGYWCLGRPSQQTVTNTAPSLTAQTRTTAYSVDYVNCRATGTTVEPGSSTLQIATTYAFDGCGNVNSVSTVGKNPDGSTMPARTTLLNHGARCQFPVTITNALSQQTNLGYRYDLGLMTSQTDPNNLTLTLVYDSFGRKTRELRPDGTATDFTLGACNSSNNYCGVSDLRFSVQIVARDTANAAIRTDSQYFDAIDRPRYAYRQLIGGANSGTITQYDALGRVASQSTPTLSSDPIWYTSYTYDLLNRPTQAQRQASESDTSNSTTQIAYQGLKRVSTDPLLHSSSVLYNAVGQVIQAFDAAGSDTDYEYDVFGNLLKTRDIAGNEITLTYNLLGMKLTSNDPDMGSWSYSHDSLGELKSQTDAKGQEVTFSYDALSRPVLRHESEGDTNWYWDTATKGIGQLDYVTSPGGYVERYFFDTSGRPFQTDITADGTTYSYNTTYNAAGLAETLTYPVSTGGVRFKVRYGYQYGVMQQVSDYTGDVLGTTFWQANAANARNQVLDTQLGNGLRTIDSYDRITGRLDSRTSGPSGAATIQDLAYGYNKAGWLTQRQDLRQNLTEAFTYDALGRMTSSTLNSVQNLSLTYDAIGNILSKSNLTSATWTYDTVKKHAVKTAGSYTFSYDANGNTIDDGTGGTISWYSYDLPNLIQSPSTVGTVSSQVLYGHARQRYKQIAVAGPISETTIYIGGLLRKVTLNGATTWKHAITTDTGIVAYHTRQSSGTNDTQYFTKDHLGSIDSITNAAGGLLVRLSFDAFGKRRKEAGWSGNVPSADVIALTSTSRDGYTGHEMLDSVEMVHMNGRVYYPKIGRFLSPDPYVQAPYDAQSLNRYSYVSNNPLTYADPSGFDRVLPIDVIAHVTSTGSRDRLGQGSVGLFGQGTGSASGGRSERGAGREDSEIIEEVITTATGLPPPDTIPPSLLPVLTVVPMPSTVGTIEEVVVEARKPCLAPAFPRGESVDKNIGTAHRARRSILAEVGSTPPYAIAATDITRRLDYFRGQVRNGGPWDYKQHGNHFEQAGNFNFGATGAALGIPDGVLYRGAGAAQVIADTSDPAFGSPFGSSPYGDDPVDQTWIQRGIDYFNSKCSSQ